MRLPRLVGRGRALELLLSAAMIDAAEAYRIGLVNRVVPADQLLAETEKLLRTILDMGPLAVAACIRVADEQADLPLEGQRQFEPGLAVARDLGIAGAAKRPEENGVVQQLEEVRLAVPVGPQEDGPAGRKWKVQIREIPEAPRDDPLRPHREKNRWAPARILPSREPCLSLLQEGGGAFPEVGAAGQFPEFP